MQKITEKERKGGREGGGEGGRGEREGKEKILTLPLLVDCS